MRPPCRRYLLPVCALLLIYADANAADMAAMALAHAERNHAQAVAALATAQSHVKNIESELEIARSIESEARRSGDKAALTVAREAVVESEAGLEEARLLLSRARDLAARRARAVEHLRAGLRTAERQAGFLVADGGDVCRFAADGSPIAEDAGPLRAGETIRTGPDGSARLFLASDLGQVQLAPDTEFTMEEDGVSGEVIARLASGRLRALVKKLMRSERFEVRTPNAAVTVRGTDFAVENSTGQTQVQVFSGLVAVTSPADGKPVEVAAGHRLAPGSSNPAPFDTRDFPAPWESAHAP